MRNDRKVACSAFSDFSFLFDFDNNIISQAAKRNEFNSLLTYILCMFSYMTCCNNNVLNSWIYKNNSDIFFKLCIELVRKRK